MTTYIKKKKKKTLLKSKQIWQPSTHNEIVEKKDIVEI